MSQKDNSDEHIRISFRLERKADPMLFDELSQFKKGSKRTEQLRSLAHDGVLAKRTSMFAGIGFFGGGKLPQAQQDRVTSGEEERDVLSEAAHDMFGPPIDS